MPWTDSGGIDSAGTASGEPVGSADDAETARSLVLAVGAASGGDADGDAERTIPTIDESRALPPSAGTNGS